MRHVSMIALALAAATTAHATTTTHICKNGSVQRRVEVNIDETNQQAGCSVKYFKDTEAPGTETIIFRSGTHTPTCMERAEAFLNKLASFGYPCTPGMGGAESTAAPATKPVEPPKAVVPAAAKPVKKAETKPVPAGKSNVISDE